MKNPNEEQLRRRMRQYHRHHPWRLDNRLFVPHIYPDAKKLCWWDDVGFILNGYRVMVWWVHPRMKYADAIADLAWKEAGDPPPRDTDFFGEKQWKKVGRSRKKVISYLMRPISEIQQDYYAKLRTIETRMETGGIDLVVHPTLSVEILSWCRGISLCIPMEVRDKEGISALAAVARRLIKRETTLADEFPGYRYGREDWLAEAELRSQDKLAATLAHEAT